MIYLDTSAALAHLLGEDRSPPTTLWKEPLVSSWLIEYEAWTKASSLASVEFLRAQNQVVLLATYDQRMLETAERMAIPLFNLP